MVTIRLRRMGRTNRAFFRLAAVDSRAPRDGRVLEELGSYDPRSNDAQKGTNLKRERIAYWLSHGAQPSSTVASILKRHGIAREPKA